MMFTIEFSRLQEVRVITAIDQSSVQVEPDTWREDGEKLMAHIQMRRVTTAAKMKKGLSEGSKNIYFDMVFLRVCWKFNLSGLLWHVPVHPLPLCLVHEIIMYLFSHHGDFI